MNADKSDFEGVDLAGIGKLAKAIPKEVYTRSADTMLATLEALLAPLTETTSGLGRYIRQKFDNMVMLERALAIFTLEKALTRAKAKAARLSTGILPPAHVKSFVKALEEASKESDPVLHEMLANLLASQTIEGFSHPHFVEILPHFSPAEAQLLVSLRGWDNVGQHGGGYVLVFVDQLRWWITHTGDPQPKEWNFSCALLCEFGFADLLSSTVKN